MNILVPISWLKDFLKTNASTQKIAEALSLCSQSVEKIHKTTDNDEVLEIEITVNRYDCLSIIGIAREAAAILPQFNQKAKLVLPRVKQVDYSKFKHKNYLEVKIENYSICPRFCAILIENVNVGPSPLWMSERLKKVNIRPINNVVDISNYLMIETGQPIHTFDFDKIRGQKMIMRLSKKGEIVKTLDGIERTLPGEDIVIEDGEGRLIDLCGIMGGENSQIDEGTKRVLFFVQAYDQTRIRKTSMNIGLRTEASARFERGIDLEGITEVVLRGVEMMEKLANGKVGGKLIDIYPKKEQIKKIRVSFEFINQKLGILLKKEKIIKILLSLGFKIKMFNNKTMEITIPFWRTKDISIPEDIVEEVARIYGYFKLPSKIPPFDENFGLKNQPLPKKGAMGSIFKWEDKAKDLLKSFGYSETYNFSFIGKDLIEKCRLPLENHLRLTNPLNFNLEYLRTSLIPSLLEITKNNFPNFSKIDIFEMANVYLKNEKDLPFEKMKLSLITTSKNFYELKGEIVTLLNGMGIHEIEFKPENRNFGNFWERNCVAKIIYKDKIILGEIGKISKIILKNFSLNCLVFGADLDFEIISKFTNEEKKFSPILKFPPVIEDLAFVFLKNVYIGEIIKKIKSCSPLIKKVDLIDSFEKTRTLRISYQHPEKSLSEREVKQVREKIINLIKESGGTLRNLNNL